MQLSGGRFCAPGSGRPAPSVPGGRPPLRSPWSCGRRGGCSAPSRCHAAPYGGSVAPLPPVFIGGRLRCGRAWGGFMGRPGWGCCKLQGCCKAVRLHQLQGCCKRTGRNQRQLIRKASAARARQSKAARCTQLQGSYRGGSDPPRAESQSCPQSIRAPRTWGSTPSPPEQLRTDAPHRGAARWRPHSASGYGGAWTSAATAPALRGLPPCRCCIGGALLPPDNCAKSIFCAVAY